LPIGSVKGQNEVNQGLIDTTSFGIDGRINPDILHAHRSTVHGWAA